MPKCRGIGPAGIVFALATIFLICAPAVAQDAKATGFVMQNRAPFAALIGVPGRWPDTSDNFAELSWNVSNNAMSDREDGFAVLADGETHTLTARFQIEAWERLRIGLQLPWIKHSGGFLDNTIDAWHDIFGLNEGIRPRLEQDQLDYVLRRQGADVVRLDESVSGLGDLQLGITGELGSFARYARPDTVSGYFLRVPWKLTLNVKLPTGDIDKLTGSGNADISIGVGWRSPDKAGARFRWWLDTGIVFPGDVDIVGLEPESQIYYYDAAMTLRIVKRLDAILQVAGNSSLYAGQTALLGEPVAQVALGGLWQISSRVGLRFGIFEDILAESAPDFGIELSILVKRW